MADPRATVRRALDGADVRPITLGAFHARRERKRRNERLAAGALGLAIALAGAVIVSMLANQGRERTGGRTTARNGAIAILADNGDLELRGPTGTVRISGREVVGSQGVCAREGSPCTFGSWSWSPDGSRLAFTHGEQSGGIVGDMSVYVVDADGTNLRLIARCPPRDGDQTGTCDNGFATPSWSPDGSQMAFMSGEVLYVAEVRSPNVRPIAGCAACGYDGQVRDFAWSPTADVIAFGSDTLLGLVTADGTTWRPIVERTDTPRPGLPAQPAWSPDGTQLAFSSELGIFTVRDDGSGLRQVAEGNAVEGPGSPSWSPDGEHIVYLATPRPDGGFVIEIRVVDADGGHERVIFGSGCCVGDYGAPIYSPDGKKIAFYAGLTPAVSGVYVMNADGTHRERSDGSGTPAWQALPA